MTKVGEKMRKNYVYAITLILMALFLWAGYYFYMEYRPVEYENGTLVEIPTQRNNEEWELSA